MLHIYIYCVYAINLYICIYTRMSYILGLRQGSLIIFGVLLTLAHLASSNFLLLRVLSFVGRVGGLYMLALFCYGCWAREGRSVESGTST